MAKEGDKITDRLVQLEDIKREIVIMHNAATLMLGRQKETLLANGQQIGYQQGSLDVWNIIEKILEGKTNFYEFTQGIKVEMEKQASATPAEMDFV